MTIQSFFKTAGTVSLKTLRVLWGFVGALTAAIAYVLGEAFKHTSAATSDENVDVLGQHDRRSLDSSYDNLNY